MNRKSIGRTSGSSASTAIETPLPSANANMNIMPPCMSEQQPANDAAPQPQPMTIHTALNQDRLMILVHRSLSGLSNKILVLFMLLQIVLYIINRDCTAFTFTEEDVHRSAISSTSDALSLYATDVSDTSTSASNRMQTSFVYKDPPAETRLLHPDPNADYLHPFTPPQDSYPYVYKDLPADTRPLYPNADQGPLTSPPPGGYRPERVEYPQATDLFTPDSLRKELTQRHKCIDLIRKRHHEALAHHIAVPAAADADIDSQQRQRKQKHILLVDPAYHRNVGDSMLTYGELTFLHRDSGVSQEKVIQCHYRQDMNLHKGCDETIQAYGDVNITATKDINAALWHAGGNWGSLYRVIQSKRIKSFMSLLQNGYKLISMPQSMFYADTTMELSDSKKLEEMVRQGLTTTTTNMAVAKERVVLTWREHASYKKAKELYPFVTNLLVPDIAFQLGPFQQPTVSESERVDLLLFLRGDKESKMVEYRSIQAIQHILDNSGNGGLTFRIVDWGARGKDRYFTESAIRLMSLGRVVIADRLHAVILSYLSGAPLVYLDQKTKKVERTLGVAFEVDESCGDGEKAMWDHADTIEEAIKKATGMIKKYNL
eukprot:804300_1